MGADPCETLNLVEGSINPSRNGVEFKTFNPKRCVYKVIIQNQDGKIIKDFDTMATTPGEYTWRLRVQLESSTSYTVYFYFQKRETPVLKFDFTTSAAAPAPALAVPRLGNKRMKNTRANVGRAAAAPGAGNGSAAPVGIAAAAPKTEEQIYLEDAKKYENKVPPNNNFLKRSYYINPEATANGSPSKWRNIMKNYVEKGKDSLQNKYNRLRTYKNTLAKKKAPNQDPMKTNRRKKNIAIDTRLQQLYSGVYDEKVKSGKLHKNEDTKAGVVLLFKDGKALYTVTQDNTYGFPKGQVDFVLRKQNDIESVEKETSKEAALRELKEETGFYIDSTTNTVKREVKGQTLSGQYTIDKIEYATKEHTVKTKKEKCYYLIIKLNENSDVKTGPSLDELTENAKKENIKEYKIEQQNKFGIKYNWFSNEKFV